MTTRRKFIQQALVGTAAFTILPRFVLGGKGFIAPSDTVYIAGIGVGGKGTSDLTGFAKHPKAKIAFLCDVDDRMAVKSKENFPDAKYYKDFRVMLDKEASGIDAVSVSTADHTHAVAAMAAMERGKHVYVQKPLTHDIYEARMLTEAAKNGHKVLLRLPENLMCQVNWTGTCGSVLRNTLITIRLIFLSTGAAGGHLEPEHWVTWVVISWMQLSVFYRSIIHRK